jgi:two-component system phosphate regulon sensor histidine kinase PhoR
VTPELLTAVAIGLVLGVLLTVAARRVGAGAQPATHGAELPAGPYDDDRTRLVLGALPFGAFLVDERGVVRFINIAAERLFRVDAGRALGQGIVAVVPSVPLERLVLAAIAGDPATRDVVVADRARELTIGVTAYPYESGAVVVAVDRSNLVALEHVRQDFVANVSHELRTPLTSMKLMIETVNGAPEDAEARSIFLPQIAGETERMIRLVEDLLEIARSESGTLLLDRTTFDLTDTAVAVVNAAAERARTLDVALDFESPEAVFVDADRDRLTQVTLNLVDNALRHTPRGGSVRVEVLREDRDAVLRVVDSGTGIPYSDLPHVFERFYVVDRSRSRDQGGTGLGLSIARHLVELHGGSITAQSVFGHGATFVCRFPAVSANLKMS